MAEGHPSFWDRSVEAGHGQFTTLRLPEQPQVEAGAAPAPPRFDWLRLLEALHELG